MKRADQHRDYRNVQDFDAPDGIVSVDIDPATGQLATGSCPDVRPEYFISGTQPTEFCRLHGGGNTQVAGWETLPPHEAEIAPAPVTAQPGRHLNTAQVAAPPPAPLNQVPVLKPKPEEKKKGFFGRLKDIFR